MQWIKQQFAHITGARAERQAEKFLRSQGLSMVARNYRCKGGEIDLIMTDSEQWVFIEVKYRESDKYGDAAEFFDSRKQQRLTRAINHYMIKKHLNPEMTAYRIDLVAINGDQINWIKSATQ